MNCPVCNRPLTLSPVLEQGNVYMYCAYGPCESEAANHGASGISEREAYKKLCAAVEKEQLKTKEGE